MWAVVVLGYCLACVVWCSSCVVLSAQVSVMLCRFGVVQAARVIGRFVGVWMQSCGISVVVLVFVLEVQSYWVLLSVWAVSVLVTSGVVQ